jgi:predicted nuclease of predicted toxin-antitoxin system
VKLLFDENLSPRLVSAFSGDFPGSAHVREVALKGSTDTLIWRFARENEFVVVSKDSDFRDLSFVAGQPPKAIWLDVGNVSTSAIVDLIRDRRD